MRHAKKSKFDIKYFTNEDARNFGFNRNQFMADIMKRYGLYVRYVKLNNELLNAYTNNTHSELIEVLKDRAKEEYMEYHMKRISEKFDREHNNFVSRP